MLRALPLIYPVVEIIVFILVGRWLGFGWAFPILLFSPLLGFLIARILFRRMKQRIPSQRSTSKRTDTFTADIAVTLLTGALLVIPGIATFVLGLLLLLPPVRSLVASRLGRTLGLRVMGLGERFTVAGADIRAARRAAKDTGDARGTRGAGAEDTAPGWGDVIDHRTGEFDTVDDITDTTGRTDGIDGTDGRPGTAR